MKSTLKLLSLLILMFFCCQKSQGQLNVLSFSEETSMINHMAEVNQEWLKHPDLVQGLTQEFESEEERIKAHLTLIIKHLKSNESLRFSRDQILKRNALLDKLTKYADTKVFPINTNHKKRNPYFIDEKGIHCAVGYLISQSGNELLAQRISKEYNFRYIKDIKMEGLIDWANEHGFTVDELKWIQPSYAPSTLFEPVGLGTNGPVTKMEDDGNERAVFIGEFDLLNGLECANIGLYEDNQLSCLGEGIPGVINDVSFVENVGIVAVGSLEHLDLVYPLAIFNDGEWTFHTIPDREGAIGECVHFGLSGYKIDLSISHTTFPDQQEMWYLTTSNEWERKVLVNGQVKDVADSGLGRFYVGQFDSFIVNGSSDIVEAGNVFRQTPGIGPGDNNFFSFGGSNFYPKEIYVVKNIGGALYFGGRCAANTGEPEICLSRYFNADIETLISNPSDIVNRQINDVEYDGYSSLIIGGSLNYLEYASYGKHLMKFDLLENTLVGHGYFDNPVNGLAIVNDELVLGGNFTQLLNFDDQELPYLAKIVDPVGFNEIEEQDQSQLYPNPFSDQIKVTGDLEDFQYEIFSITGHLIKQGIAEGHKVNNLQDLSPGIYSIAVHMSNKTINYKLLKQ